jgi:hypothetical protein
LAAVPRGLWTIANEFVEVETGKGADTLDRRPQLAAALVEARRQRCAVAKLDPLSRDVRFISELMARARRKGTSHDFGSHQVGSFGGEGSWRKTRQSKATPPAQSGRAFAITATGITT